VAIFLLIFSGIRIACGEQISSPVPKIQDSFILEEGYQDCFLSVSLPKPVIFSLYFSEPTLKYYGENYSDFEFYRNGDDKFFVFSQFFLDNDKFEKNQSKLSGQDQKNFL
jgi:hypothetical protein